MSSVVKVYVIIAVHNRFEYTKRIIDCLRNQSYKDIEVWVVDDGSNDGTKQYLEEQADIRFITGDGNLWWGGATNLAMKKILEFVDGGDYILLLNNDTTVASDYVETIVNIAQENSDAVIGSVLRSQEPPHDILSIGPIVDNRHLKITDLLDELPEQETTKPRGLYDLSTLPGRGVLYPVKVLLDIGTIRNNIFPHYWSDYELASRAKKYGYKTLLSTSAVVYSTDKYGNDTSGLSFLKRYFGKRSPANVFTKFMYFFVTGNLGEKILLFPRFCLCGLGKLFEPLLTVVNK